MIIFILAVLGLCLGSFINAFVWRLREQETWKHKKGTHAKKYKHSLSIIHGRSMCPSCQHELKAGDLIPIISWISLRGRCRYCHTPISWQYPIVELLTATAFIASYQYWPYDWNSLGIILFSLWLVILGGFFSLIIYDIRWMLLPNRIVYFLLSIVIVQTVVAVLYSQKPANVIINAILGFICLGGLFYVLYQISNGRWIGGGDVKLGFVLGILVGGPANSFLLLFIASLMGSIVSIPLLVTKKLKKNSRLPFGPFLIIAAIIVYLFGASIINWYKNHLLVV